jgi:hypothetical protein
MRDDDLKREIDWLADGIPPPPRDVREVVRGGTAMRRRRRAVAGVFTVAALAGTAGMVSTVAGPERSSGRLSPAGPAVITKAPEAPRVATFAVRAVARAGLLDPTGTFNDYDRVERIGGAAWDVSFATSICRSDASCDPHPEGNVNLRVEIERGNLVVTGVGGPLSPDARERLLSYAEQPTPEGFGLEFPTVEIESIPDEGLSVVASPLWRGTLGAPAGVVECRVELYDENGDVVYEGPTREQPVPESESMRAGAQHIFGVQPDAVQGDPASADVVCETT